MDKPASASRSGRALLDPSVYDVTDQYRSKPMADHPCTIECQRQVHKGYPKCVDTHQCDHGQIPERSIADLIPEWYDGGTKEQMLDEAFAHIRRLESAAAVSERGGGEAVALILAEVERARRKHPAWPANDTLFAAAIVSEESGELMRAAVQHKGEGGSLDACDKEAIQTAAVAIRFLERK